MRELSFMGPSNDGQRLLLVDGDGNEFELAVDQRLVAVITREHGPTPRARVRATPPTPIPSPREIQDRVRHGESISDIATEADVDEELIARFAHPVITERGHICVQARAAHVLVGGERVTLEDSVSGRVRIRAVDPSSIRWDAWRRPDGTWSVVAAYPAAQGDRVATFTYNQRDDSVVAVDDEAQWLLEQSADLAAPTPESRVPSAGAPAAVKSAGPRPPTNINDGPRHSEAARPAKGPERPATTASTSEGSGEDPKPTRAWDQSHPAARAAQRRESATELSHPAGTAQHRAADATPGASEARAASGEAPESASPGREKPTTPASSPDNAPHWEELLFGSPKDDE